MGKTEQLKNSTADAWSKNAFLTSSYRDIEAWKKAHEFVLFVYKHTDDFPKNELFGIVSQIRRAATSIPANIAEGYRKHGKADKLRFYNIAQGSIEECDYF